MIVPRYRTIAWVLTAIICLFYMHPAGAQIYTPPPSSAQKNQSLIDSILPLNLKLYTASIDEEKKFAGMIKRAQFGRSKDPLLYAAFNAQKTLQNNPNDLTANETLCDAYFQTGYIAAATKQCRDVLKINPESPLAKTVIADIAFRSGKTDGAESLLKQVITQNKNYSRANLILSEIAKSRGDNAAAMSQIAEAVSTNPDAASLLALANMQLQSQQYDQAANSYLKVLQISPENTAALTGLATVYSGRGDYARALDFAQKAAASDSNSALAQYALGTQYEKTNRAEEAIVSYGKAVRIDPQFAMAHRALGIALLKKGAPVDAIQSLTRALQLIPNDAEAMAAMADAYRGLGDNATADRIQSQIPKQPQPQIDSNAGAAPLPLIKSASADLLQSAKAAERQGNYEQARQLYEKMAIAEPGHAEHFYNLGRIYAIGHKWDQAARFFKISIERDGNFAPAYAELAKMQCYSGDGENAWANYSNANRYGFVDKDHTTRNYLTSHCPQAKQNISNATP